MNCKLPTCKNEFEPTTKRQKFCCRECKDASRNQSNKRFKKGVLTPEVIKKCKELANSHRRWQIADIVGISKTAVGVAINGRKKKEQVKDGYFDFHDKDVITGFSLYEKMTA